MINPSPRTKAIVVMFMFIILMYVVYIVNKAFIGRKIENFEQEEKEDRKKTENDGQDIEYNNRLYVMKMFDGMFNRKPSTDEIEKYSGFGNEKEILAAILEDYDKLEKNVENKEVLPSITDSKKNANKEVLPFDEFAEDSERILDDTEPNTKKDIKAPSSKTEEKGDLSYDKQILREKIKKIEIEIGGLKEYLDI